MKINNDDITVVLQGPIHYADNEQKLEESTTWKSVASIRKYLPGCKIILSTWQGQDADKLDVDEIIYNEDPGSIVMAYYPGGEPRRGNENRQIVSSRNGLKSVQTKYAMKLRADVVLTANTFLDLYSRYNKYVKQDCLFKQRVVVTSMYFRRSVGARPVVYCQSDWLQFGTTDDLLTIWDIPLLKDYPFDENKINEPQHLGAPDKVVRTTEQILCQTWLKKLDAHCPELTHRMDGNASVRHYWERFMASNLIVADPAQFGIMVPPEHMHEYDATNVMRFYDWLKLYKKYCDKTVSFPYLDFIKTLGFRRLLKFPISHIRFTLAVTFKWKF